VTSGEGDVGAEAPAEEMDLRDRIYEMLRPVDWTAEATEPSGECANPLTRMMLSTFSPELGTPAFGIAAIANLSERCITAGLRRPVASQT
jgi:hypothetical protein